MLVGPRRDAVNVHALVGDDHGGARLLPRLLNDGRYALPNNVLTDNEYRAAHSILSEWSNESPSIGDYATQVTRSDNPQWVLVDNKQMWQAGRKTALTMPASNVFRYEVHVNDFEGVSDSNNQNRRSELVSQWSDGVGAGTVWMSFCVILGDAPGLTKTTHGIVYQWHSVDTNIPRSPVLSVNIASDGLKIRTASSSFLYGGSGTGTRHPLNGIFVDRYTTSVPVKGAKTYIVMQATFGESGHLNAWINGSQVIDSDIPIGYYTDLTDASGRTILGYPQFGCYTANLPDTNVVYHANPEWGVDDLSARITSPLPVPDLTW